MPIDEIKDVTNTESDELDFLRETPSGDQAADSNEQPTDGSTASDGDTSAADTAPVNEFGDLPFKDVPSLVAAHKELQRAYTSGRVEFGEMRSQMNRLEKAIQASTPQTPAQEASKEVLLDRIGNFFEKGPEAIVNGIVKPLESRLSAIERENAVLKNERDLNRFYADVKDYGLTTQDEERLVEIIKSTPRIAALPSLYDRIDAAMDKLLRAEPTRFSSRKKAPVVEDASLSAAKAGAGTLGGKAGGKGAAPEKDEFDLVLEQDAKARARW